MTYDIFLTRVMHRTGIDDRALAQELTHHVVERLAHCIEDDDAQLLAENLPNPLGELLVHHAGEEICDLDALYHSVAERLSVDLSFGLEFTQVVFQIIGETVGLEGRQLLQNRLPQPWHPYFEPRRTPLSPPGRHRHDRRTLASAQPGSSRPLSEAMPGHRNSIARSDHPQLGSKLSTSHGKPQRRTLASGRPGSSRPLSEG